MSTIIASERPALHLAPDTVHRVAVADLADLLMWVGIDHSLGTVVFTAARLPQSVQDDLYELGLGLVDGGLAPSMAWVGIDCKYHGTIRKCGDAGPYEIALRGAVNLGSLGGAK